MALAIVTPNIIGLINIIAGIFGCVVFSVTPALLLFKTDVSIQAKLFMLGCSLIVTQFGFISSVMSLVD